MQSALLISLLFILLVYSMNSAMHNGCQCSAYKIIYRVGRNLKLLQHTNKTTYDHETRWRLLLWCQPSLGVFFW